MNELNYRKIKALNQSHLKKVLSGPAFATKNEEQEERDHFVLGQYVEDLCFDADVSQYLAFDFPSRTTNVGKFTWAIYQHFLENEGVWPNSTQCEAIYGVLGVKKPNVTTLIADTESILRPISNISLDTHIISPEIKSKAEFASKKVKEDVLTSKMLNSDDITQSITKVPITWLHDDDEKTLCKGEIDLLRVNHEKRMVRIVDIKTLSDAVYRLDRNFWKYRYDFQLSFYKFGLSRSQFFKDNYEGYTILPPMIVAVDFMTEAPLIYQLKQETLDIGEHGGKTPTGYEVKGWREAIELHKFYEEYGYRYPKEVVINKYIEI